MYKYTECRIYTRFNLFFASLQTKAADSCDIAWSEEAVVTVTLADPQN